MDLFVQFYLPSLARKESCSWALLVFLGWMSIYFPKTYSHGNPSNGKLIDKLIPYLGFIGTQATGDFHLTKEPYAQQFLVSQDNHFSRAPTHDDEPKGKIHDDKNISPFLLSYLMDTTFANQLADEWSRLQDFLENTVRSDFSFRDPYVPAEFPIMYAQYQQLMANLPNQREVYTAQHPSPWRRANLEREIHDILEIIPGFDIRNDPYYSHYRDTDSQPPIPSPD
ncbi:hypothetical protein RHGRI_029695 [Rhododendron griersonianum]|uniref:Uncharacterized protein n=1 Tax=Rhododendron griersonianum TaxID=479676 RepID=A0AAV6IQT7_9ERIC|nr:hypothetical protein RHGRI_029695 [Rhododendron griersonianum]